MIKIAIIGGAGIWHANSFSEMFNGYDRDLAQKNNYPLYNARIEGARVTHLWDADKEKAGLLAKICGIENVVPKMEDVIGKVDGVIITDDLSMQHQKKAEPFLKAGIPAFIDKPLSTDIKEAETIIGLAKKYNCPMMSCSALRYAKEVEAFLLKKDEIGDILTGNTTCSGDLIFYGIHAFEQLYAVIGPGIKSVRNLGSEGKDMVVVTKKDGRQFILTVFKDIGYLFQMNLYGAKGWRQVVVEDSNYFYSNMLSKFVEMVKTKKMPFPPEETLEVIKVLVLGRQSAQTRAELSL